MIIDMPTVSMGNTNGSIVPAEKVSYDGTISGLTADNVQDAIDEMDSMSDYSDVTEKVVGTWEANGVRKPLYRQVLSGVLQANNAEVLIGTIYNVEFMKFGVISVQENTSSYATGNSTFSVNDYCVVYFNNNQVKFNNNHSAWVGKTAYVVVEYTKTTDAPII